MLRDEKYRPRQIKIYCPVCDEKVDIEEWRDFGMHLKCTEYFSSGRYLKTRNASEKREEFTSKTMINEI